MAQNGNGKKDDGAGVFGWVAGGVALVAVAVAGFFGFRALAKKKPGVVVEDPDVPEKKKEEPAASEPAKTATTATKSVPAKTQTPYNKTMFAKPGDANGVLAGLTALYALAISGGTSGGNFMSHLAMFQKHWNDLAKAKKLVPSSLNQTRLTVDGKIGTQSRRALEWADGMDWPARLKSGGLLS